MKAISIFMMIAACAAGVSAYAAGSPSTSSPESVPLNIANSSIPRELDKQGTSALNAAIKSLEEVRVRDDKVLMWDNRGMYWKSVDAHAGTQGNSK